MRHAYLLLLPLLTLAGTQAPAMQATQAATAANPEFDYPATTRQDLVETHFNIEIADPYRWLENDVREDRQVRDWVTAQNVVTDAYLETLPGRDIFKARITELYDYERFGIPEKKGGRYFYTRNDGLQNQSVLYVRAALRSEARREGYECVSACRYRWWP